MVDISELFGYEIGYGFCTFEVKGLVLFGCIMSVLMGFISRFILYFLVSLSNRDCLL